MRKFFFTFITLSVLVFAGCSSDNEQINQTELRQLIIEATAGDTDANARLQGLLSARHIGKSDYNQLYIDSLNIGDMHYFSVLLEYFDPTLNLFAIYDGKLNFFLLDKSLNGYLSSEWIKMGDRKFVFVQERFLTKDVLSLDRLSIYEVFDSSASLIYRSLSQFSTSDDSVYQTVESITPNFITTKVGGANESEGNILVDTFYFKSESQNYLSEKNIFNNYVKQEIGDFSWIITKPEIPSKE
ncbi:MAG: hypothetical protein MUE93_06710 [Ignavibacteriaceae bacterium]|jgi:hypothetical protein|nr:hypothetical protein [Ignavibacteriaceae bacterium]MCU0365344.1 hypothetical protein [Ignavibacteriaceae bacterium]MCU0406170.1 hypothetical protein [Ignavibacteriaceae bacterium]MCU0415362.1 hypothetical protein [Ignavibacteriaceae bacterium]